MRKMCWWLGVAGSVIGCWSGAADEASAPAPAPTGAAAVSPEFVVSAPVTSAPPAATIAPLGEGVTLRWDPADTRPLPVVTHGLGAVTRTVVDASGGVTLAHAYGVEERWSPVAHGAEQSWRYARRPDGGRVAVAVTFAGLAFERADADGLSLRAPDGSLVRYSHATWVGADGARTAVPARWADDRIALDVPAGVVAQTRFPAVLDPTVSAHLDLSPSHPNAQQGAVEMGLARVVQTSTSTLLLSSTRVRPSVTALMTAQAYDLSGVPVPNSFRGVPATAFMDFPGEWEAASYGTGVMVVGRTWTGGVVAARLQPSGVSIDRTPIVVRPDRSPRLYDFKLACSASTCLVTYRNLTTTGAESAVFASRVGVDGRLLDASPLTLGRYPTDTLPVEPPNVVALADRFIVAWTNLFPGSPTNVVAARVMADGRVLDEGGRAVSIAGAARSLVQVATDGTRVFMRWYATASGSRLTGWYTQLFDADLNPLSSLAYHSDLSHSVGDSGMQLWWDGTHYVHLGDIFVGSSRQRKIVRFDATGARVDAVPLNLGPIAGRTGPISTARGGFFRTDGAVRRFDTLGTQVGADWPIVQGFSPPEEARLDSDGNDFLASWFEGRLSGGRTPVQSLVRLNSSGFVRDVPPVTVPIPLPAGSWPASSVTHEGARANLFRFSGLTDRYERRTVDLDARTSSAALPINAFGKVIRGGAQRLLLGGGCATRFDTSWANLDPVPVCFATSPTASVADFDGTHFAFVYRVALPTSSTLGHLFLRRMNRDGDFLDTPAISLASLGFASNDPFALAFGAGTHLLAWSDENSNLRALRIAPDGTFGAPISLGRWTLGTIPGPHPLAVAAVFDGTNFVLAWPGRPAETIRVARVSPAGAVLDAVPFTVIPGGLSQPLFAPFFEMATDGRGSTLFVYNAFDVDLASEQIRAVYFREDGVVLTDAGANPVDAVAPTDTPAVDVPRDTGGPLVDVGTPIDLGSAIDSGSPADTGSPTDMGAPGDVVTTEVGLVDDGPSPDDAPTVLDAGVVVDRPVSADAGASDVGSVDTGPPDDGGSICDVGGTPGRGTGRGFVALAALSLVGLRRGARRRSATSPRA